jgi:3-deoxy-D-manno-octulosonate 8-phosphate phosphatase (KDO 8-P phosphatase)
MDIDGVLTGGEIILLNTGEEVKCWNAKDRLGLVLAHQKAAGLRLAWISGRKSKTVLRAAREFKIDALALGVHDKGRSYVEIRDRLGLRDHEIAFIGDDLTDLPVLRRVGLACCPRDAVPDVRNQVHYVARFSGGRGVFREILELVLHAQGTWKTLLRNYEA